MKNTMEKYRKEIDEIDDQIISLLARRTTVVKKIGAYKIKNSIPALDVDRWNDLLKSRIQKGESFNLPESFTQYIFTVIHEYSVSVQGALAQNQPEQKRRTNQK